LERPAGPDGGNVATGGLLLVGGGHHAPSPHVTARRNTIRAAIHRRQVELEAALPLLAYPIETVLAEKLMTMIVRVDTTTRGRDFADVLLLTGVHDIDAASMSDAIAATATVRQIEMRPVSDALLDLGPDGQREWQRLITRAG
jgi:hypothetical protein